MKITDFTHERKLSKDEEKKKEKIVKGMKKNKKDFKKRYGDEAEAVMYATATKRAKGESVQEAKKLKEFPNRWSTTSTSDAGVTTTKFKGGGKSVASDAGTTVFNPDGTKASHTSPAIKGFSQTVNFKGGPRIDNVKNTYSNNGITRTTNAIGQPTSTTVNYGDAKVSVDNKGFKSASYSMTDNPKDRVRVSRNLTPKQNMASLNKLKQFNSIQEMDPKFPHTAMTSGFINWLKGQNLTMKQVADPMTRWNLMKQYQKETGKNIIPLDPMKKEMQEMTEWLKVNEGYYSLPPIDRKRYDDLPGMEGPMMTVSGKVVYYDPKMGAYYDRDSDMYLSYDEFQALDKPTMRKVDEALKYNFMVLDRDGRVMGMTTGERDAMQMARGDNIRGETGTYVKLRRPMSQTRGDRLIGQLPAHNLGESKTYMTEAEFDEAAGEKDACYHKVKARYKVWPSAYASGALVQCRKKGAKNWGNSKKK